MDIVSYLGPVTATTEAVVSEGAHSMDSLPARFAAVVRGCQEDDPAAWEAFLHIFRAMAQKTLRRLCLTSIEREEAEDNARANVVRVILAGRFADMKGLEPVWYVYRVIRNAGLDVLKGRRRPGNADEVDFAPTLLPSEAARLAEVSECMEGLLGTWNEVDRFIFLAKIEGVGSKLIVAQLAQLFRYHTSAGGVDTRFNRLRGKARQQCG